MMDKPPVCPSSTRFACTNEQARPRNMVPIFNKLYLLTLNKWLVTTLMIIIILIIIRVIK